MAKTKLSESFRHDAARGTKLASTRKLIKHVAGKLPPLTAAQRREIAALKRMPESSIDFGDIPELRESYAFRHAVRANPFVKRKQQLTVRIDSDIFEWLRGFGKGYQTRLNAILREAMRCDRARKK